jgi:alkanesulfonate monooxygenase SsuD/methylene tetrahydromethanopterin reductase-like flavin-dependent oxidoreductase (luciferase family)
MLDIISNGRLEFGLSAGWYKREFEAYRFDFLKASARVEMLEESIKIIKMMLVENLPVSFCGKYFKVKGAICNPKPIQRPYPPLWIGGSGVRTIEIAAKHATAGITACAHMKNIWQNCRSLRIAANLSTETIKTS